MTISESFSCAIQDDTTAALQRLRILKTSETGENTNFVGTIEGRARYPVLTLGPYAYEEYAMRRKMHVLAKINGNTTSKKTTYSKLANTKQSTYRHLSNATINNLQDNKKCDNYDSKYQERVPAYFAGIKGDTTELFLDISVPYHPRL